MKSTFLRFGKTNKVLSDNCPQYASRQVRHFTKTYDFTHETSSPEYFQSNGLLKHGKSTIGNRNLALLTVTTTSKTNFESHQIHLLHQTLILVTKLACYIQWH